MNIFMISDMIEVTKDEYELFSSYYAYGHLIFRIVLIGFYLMKMLFNNFRENINSFKIYYPILVGYKENYKIDHFFDVL